MKNAPCLNCPDRVVGCHSSCSSYLEYAEERKDIRNKRQAILRGIPLSHQNKQYKTKFYEQTIKEKYRNER